MKSARQLDADRVQAIIRTATVLGWIYHVALASAALVLTLCAAAEMAR